jgi:glucose-6-phosphate isomerase
MQAYTEHERKYTSITIEEINEFTLGSLMQTWMLHTIMRASLLDINAFNQPAVEHYKKHTKENLSR